METPIRISVQAMREMSPEQYEAIQDRCKLYDSLDHADILLDYHMMNGVDDPSPPWLYAIWYHKTGQPIHMGIAPDGRCHT